MGFLLVYLHLNFACSKVWSQGYAHFDNKYLGNGYQLVNKHYCHQIGSCVWAFDWRNYLWPLPFLKVKVMHISTMNIFEMVRYRRKLLLPWNSKSCMGFRLAYLYLTLDHHKGQGQGHANFDNRYLGNGDRYGKNYYWH